MYMGRFKRCTLSRFHHLPHSSIAMYLGTNLFMFFTVYLVKYVCVQVFQLLAMERVLFSSFRVVEGLFIFGY